MLVLALAGCLPRLSNALWEGPPTTTETTPTVTDSGTPPPAESWAIEAVAVAGWVGEVPNGRFGAMVGVVGDLTGDGWAELAVGAPGSDSDGDGAVYLIEAGDVSFAPPGLQDVDQAWARIDLHTGGPENIRDGQWVVDVRDPSDALVAVAMGNTQLSEDRGVVYLVHAVDGAVPAGRYFAEDAPGGVTVWTDDAVETFGHSVLTGEFDDRPGQELVVSAPTFEVASQAGAIYVLPGAVDGLVHDVGAEHLTRLHGEGRAAHTGRGLSAIDFDGDGVSDLAVGAPGINRAYLTAGPFDGDGNLADRAERTFRSEVGGFGQSVHSVPLAGGPGLVVVSSAGWHLFGDLADPVPELTDEDAVVTLGPRVDRADQTCDDAQSGDFDGDGTQDLAVGDCTVTRDLGGTVHLFHGVDTLAGQIDLGDADLILAGVWEKTGGELACLDCGEGNGWLVASALGFDFGGSSDLGVVFLVSTRGP